MERKTFEPVDVAIVGGGVVGCSTAWQLALAGLRVAIFERATIASEQSSRAWGFIRQQGRNPAEIPLAVEAKQLWADLTQRYGQAATEFTEGGILVPAITDVDQERVERGHELAKSFSMKTRILDRRAMEKLIPELRGDWRSGLFTPDDAYGDPAASTRTIARAAREAGATIHENEAVLEVEMSGGQVAGVVTLKGRCAASTVVLAGGVGTPALARKVGLNLPIQIIVSSVGRTQRAQRFTGIAMWGPKVAYRPAADGSLIVGNGYRGVGADYIITPTSFRNIRHFVPAYRDNWRLLRLTLGRDFLSQTKAILSAAAAARPLPEPHPNTKKVSRNMKEIQNIFPHLAKLELAQTWAGRIDLTPDVIPIIDRPASEHAIFVAVGFSGHGFALGPSIGKQLAEWIVRGSPSIDLSRFRLSRFTEGSVTREQHSL
ncbi:glycine/D-amino acid oxidase-like deaminating enzyme [Rhodoligotrophos appendicifer]|uniref:NAD(P)/FAD-dependent oxidoreductase n=1 Tax=Rhodoligotrophos appendicifer TaxID=987056 RepID=UPI001187145B|nr:FAD-dependent oxidoreductase [Rhodoligotrophos appendicifer]